MSRSARLPTAGLCALGIVLWLAIGYPWTNTASSSTVAALVEIFSGSAGQQAIVNSILVSLCSVVGATVLGTFLAASIRFGRIPFSRVARVAASLPLALPPLVGAASFYFLMSEGGVLPSIIESLLRLEPGTIHIEGFWAVVVIHVHAFYIYSYFLVDDALSTIDRSEVEAGQLMNAGPVRIAATIIFPQVRDAMVRAGLLTFIASLASFSAPLLFGGGMRFLTTEIFNAKVNGSPAEAASYATLLSLASIFVLLLSRRRKGASKGTGVSLVRKAGMRNMVLVMSTWLVLVVIALPPVLLVLLSFAADQSLAAGLFPAAYSFEHFFRLFSNASAIQPIVTSLWLGVLTVVITTLIAFAGAYGNSRQRIPPALRKAVEILTTLPAAIPGTVLGINILLAFSVPHVWTGNIVLTGTAITMVLAYVTRTLPFASQGLASGISGIASSLEEAATSLGSSSMRTIRMVILPVLRPALLSTAVFTFVSAFGEFPASTLLFTPQSRPASIEILQLLRTFDLGAAAAMGVVMIVISATVIAIGRDRTSVVM